MGCHDEPSRRARRPQAQYGVKEAREWDKGGGVPSRGTDPVVMVSDNVSHLGAPLTLPDAAMTSTSTLCPNSRSHPKSAHPSQGATSAATGPREAEFPAHRGGIRHWGRTGAITDEAQQGRGTAEEPAQRPPAGTLRGCASGMQAVAGSCRAALVGRAVPAACRSPSLCSASALPLFSGLSGPLGQESAAPAAG